MAFVNMSDLYAYIHKVLREDTVILELMGITGEPDPVELATRIQKRRRPSGVTSHNNFPMITFYTNPGSRGYNHLEYMTSFDFDIYTADDVETAMAIHDRINELFDDKYVGIATGSQFKAEWLTGSEVDTNLENTYKFFTQILFTLGIEG